MNCSSYRLFTHYFTYLLLGFLFTFLSQPLLAKDNDSYAGKVVVIPIGEDTLTSSQGFQFVKRILHRAQEEKATAIILELNTPGGLAWETSELMMKSLHPATIPTYAFVNTKAMSAGALIAAACQKIYMAPISSIGAAGLIAQNGQEIDSMSRKKLESAFTAFTRSVVTEKGHNTELIKAMMIPKESSSQYGSVTLEKGELLTLTGKEATEKDASTGKPLLATGIVNTAEQLIHQEGITAPIIKALPTGFEQIAFWLATLSPLLIIIGMGAIYWEFKTPGLGMGAVIALIAFGLFFFGNNIAGNLAGYETAALFILGIGLLIVEFFILPGFIIFGLSGVVLILFALFGGMIDGLEWEKLAHVKNWSSELIINLISMPLLKLSLGIGGGTLLITLLIHYFPRMNIFKHLINADSSGSEEKSTHLYSTETPPILLGAQGISSTELRPVGKMIYQGNYFDVNARDGFHAKGTPLIVVDIQSYQIIVEKAPENSREQTEKTSL